MGRKLDDTQVARMRELFKAGVHSMKELAYIFGVSYPTVSRICRYKRRQNQATKFCICSHYYDSDHRASGSCKECKCKRRRLAKNSDGTLKTFYELQC